MQLQVHNARKEQIHNVHELIYQKLKSGDSSGFISDEVILWMQNSQSGIVVYILF